jgi:predicted phage-related endonuclease
MSFDPETRRLGWYATDSRRAVSGYLVDVLLEKRGEKQPDDLSGIEAVQMGLKMQSTIGRLFQDETGIVVQDLDVVGEHHKETWLKAHTDFSTGDGGLLEVKNFHGSKIKDYSPPDEPLAIPEADMIQCIHEATVFNVPHIYFAVLFGGQAFRWWRIEVTDQMKDEFLQKAAKWWVMAQGNEMPQAESVEQAKKIYRQSMEGTVVTTAQVEKAVYALKEIKEQIKTLESQEDALQTALQNYIAGNSELVTPYGETLVTWKSSKATKSFDKDLFKQAMPDIYKQFEVEKPGARRFLVK